MYEERLFPVKGLREGLVMVEENDHMAMLWDDAPVMNVVGQRCTHVRAEEPVHKGPVAIVVEKNFRYKDLINYQLSHPCTTYQCDHVFLAMKLLFYWSSNCFLYMTF